MRNSKPQNTKQQIITLEASLAEEAAWTPRDLFPEQCGLAAAIHLPNASRYVHDCLLLQEHRGEHGAGILSFDQNKSYLEKRLGGVRGQFLGFDFSKKLPGNIAIGHNRYATKGSALSERNTQPVYFKYTKYGPLAIAHNGTLIERQDLRAQLLQSGHSFQTTMDTEIFGQLIASSKAGNLEQAVLEAAQKIPVAYSLLVFSEKQIFALRDRFGVRPLSFGKLDKGYLICSENYALDQYLQIRDVQEVKPGEMLIFDTQSPRLQRKQYAETNEHFCIFEAIYFSDPRSRYNGIWHEDFRHALGVKLYEENPDLQGDFIVPVLETGKHAAIGLSEYSGIPYKEYFKRQRNRSRTNRRSFTSASQEERVRTARQKQHLRKEKVKGKHIVIVDDTIVRSTTIRLINRRLREAGVASITNCISAPPITDVCLYGIDIQDKEQLVAYKYKSIDEIAKEVDADRMIYLSLEGLNQVVAQTYRCGICSACFGGRKPKVCAQEPLKDV